MNSYWRVRRKNLTFAFEKLEEEKIKKRYWLQLSTVEPWLLPQKRKICDDKVTLWGWLFFYVGCDTDMLKK